MKRQARGGTSGAGPNDAFDVISPAAAADPGYTSADAQGGAELLEDRTVRIAGGGHGRRAGLSIPGAIAGTFLVAALALGAALGPLAADPTGAGHEGAGQESSFDAGDSATEEPKDGGEDGETAEDHDGATDGDESKDGEDADEPNDGEDADSEKEPTEPTDKPEPDPAPDAKAIEIGLALDGTFVVVEWSACETDGFAYYKVIRSKDEFATWPLGAGDSLAAAIEDQGVTRFVDKGVEAGRTYHYKVVALRLWEGEKVVACRSDTKAITTPAPKPEPTDDNGTMGLTVAIKEGHPFIDWTACEGVDFDYYKVVRSTDSTVTYPTGDNDQKVAAVEKGGETKAWDGDAPGGKKLWYRVFCVKDTESGWVAVAASPAKAVETPASEPAPDPKALGFEAGLTDGGAVSLSWEVCGVDNFAYYKVVRSTTTENPSYFPWTDGTELIGVVENQETTHLVDTNVESGQTIYYRIQCLGYWNGEKTLRGQTSVIAVTIP